MYYSLLLLLLGGLLICHPTQPFAVEASYDTPVVVYTYVLEEVEEPVAEVPRQEPVINIDADIVLYGSAINLPVSVSYMNDLGWQNIEALDKLLLEPGERFDNVMLINSTAYVTADIYNPNDVTSPLKDCVVVRLCASTDGSSLVASVVSAVLGETFIAGSLQTNTTSSKIVEVDDLGTVTTLGVECTLEETQLNDPPKMVHRSTKYQGF